MKNALIPFLLSICIVCMPISLKADVDPTPYPTSLIESVLGQYTNCSWEKQGVAYLFTGTPYDGEVFAVLYDGYQYNFTIQIVDNGAVQSSVESSTALFQEPVTELYMEVENEINIYFASGSTMCFFRDRGNQWKLSSYTKCSQNGQSFYVGLFDGPLTTFSYQNPITGESEDGILCGRLQLNMNFQSVNAQQLPDSPDALRERILQSDSSEFYLMDKVYMQPDSYYYASCRISEQTADIRIYSSDEITRFDEGKLVRVLGYDIYVDANYKGAVSRNYNSQYDYFHDNTDITVDILTDSEEIIIIPRWDDGSADTIYAFAFLIK